MHVCVWLSIPSSAAVMITHSMKLDPATGLSTTSSTLQYAATKEDIGAVFACVSTHELTSPGQETDLEPFPIHCEWNTALPPGSITVLHLLFLPCPHTLGCQED